MERCEYCGKLFDKEYVADRFDAEHGDEMFLYEHFRKNLCYECAEEAINNKNDGAYFETCEVCGKDFDFGDEYSSFYDMQRFGDRETDLHECWLKHGGPICADCAMQKYM